MYVIYSRSPLSEPVIGFVFLVLFFVKDVGENLQERRIICNSRSPFYEPKCCIFNGPNFNPIYDHFLWATFCHGLSAMWWYTQWRGPYTMYIYSLGHFLTTKGALIDGDWGGSKKGQNLT